LITLVLLGGAGYYIWSGSSRNTDALGKLTDVVNQIKALIDKKPSPGNKKTDNRAIAIDQDKQLRDWISQANVYFQPIPAIPDDTNVAGAQFSSALQKTVERLHQEADASNVVLPPKFEFSFTVEKDRVTFAPAGLPALAQQLGEVKALSEILFAARINAIDGIQRVRVSDDDAAGPMSDYTDQHPVTNELSVVTPYVITFRCFTVELSHVLSGFATSPNSFIVKSVNVQRAEGSSFNATEAGQPGGVTPLPQPGLPPSTAQSSVGKGGLPTVLKEQQLRVTMEVDLVKLLPKT
jgi:hypothetical protein